jgi:hypothetical protein
MTEQATRRHINSKIDKKRKFPITHNLKKKSKKKVKKRRNK